MSQNVNKNSNDRLFFFLFVFVFLNFSQRTVRTSELMMLDRMIVSDIQEEISLIQTDLKNINEEMAAMPPAKVLMKENCAMQQKIIKQNVNMENLNQSEHRKNSDEVKVNSLEIIESEEKPQTGISIKKPNFESVVNSPLNNLNQMIKDEVKGEPDLIPTTVTELNSALNKKSTCKSQINSAKNNSTDMVQPQQSHDIDIKPSFHQLSNKENSLSQLDLNFSYDSHLLGIPKRDQTSFDVKKELDNLDIESEITPSYIIKKCDQTNRDVVHSPLSTSDFDYLCSPSDSNTNHTTTNRKKDELISCDKEPYDEWLCIQKELNLISDKRSNEHLNIDGFMESTLRNFNNDDESPCSSSKLNVDNQFSDLFNQRPNDSHDLDDEKNDMDNHLPLSELFNDTIVHNDDDNVNSTDKSVENRLENMFNDNGEFDKTNDLVESRLEELFHGSTSPQPSMNSQVNNQSFHHVENHSEFLMSHQQTAGQNKRHWPNNGDVLPQMSMNQLHPSKRSCMMTSYIDATNSTDDNQWIMDCQQSSSYDFMTSDNHIDTDQRAKFTYGTTHSWNMRGNSEKCDAQLDSSSSAQWEMRLTSGKCDSPLNKCDSSLDKCDARLNSMSVKNSDLERDLLGLSAHSSPSALDSANSVLMHLQQNHIHNDTVYQTSLPGNSGNGNSGDGNGTQSNSNNNSMAPSFDDDINQHVQNAIDSILNLQNSESESLHYLDQTMSSFLADSPLTPNMMQQQNSTNNDFHYVSPPQQTHQKSPNFGKTI